MNENHERYLLTTFRHIDNLLSEAEHILSSAGAASLFAEYTQDSSPVQRKADALLEAAQRKSEPILDGVSSLSNHFLEAGSGSRFAGYAELGARNTLNRSMKHRLFVVIMSYENPTSFRHSWELAGAPGRVGRRTGR
jgi:hypothetical protein